MLSLSNTRATARTNAKGGSSARTQKAAASHKRKRRQHRTNAKGGSSARTQKAAASHKRKRRQRTYAKGSIARAQKAAAAFCYSGGTDIVSPSSESVDVSMLHLRNFSKDIPLYHGTHQTPEMFPKCAELNKHFFVTPDIDTATIYARQGLTQKEHVKPTENLTIVSFRLNTPCKFIDLYDPDSIQYLFKVYLSYIQNLSSSLEDRVNKSKYKTFLKNLSRSLIICIDCLEKSFETNGLTCPIISPGSIFFKNMLTGNIYCKQHKPTNQSELEQFEKLTDSRFSDYDEDAEISTELCEHFEKKHIDCQGFCCICKEQDDEGLPEIMICNPSNYLVETSKETFKTLQIGSVVRTNRGTGKVTAINDSSDGSKYRILYSNCVHFYVPQAKINTKNIIKIYNSAKRQLPSKQIISNVDDYRTITIGNTRISQVGIITVRNLFNTKWIQFKVEEEYVSFSDIQKIIDVRALQQSFSKNMRILSYNVHNGLSASNSDGKQFRDTIIEKLNADICAFQEANASTGPNDYETTVYEPSKMRPYGQAISTKNKSSPSQYNTYFLPSEPAFSEPYKSVIELHYAHFIIVCVHLIVMPNEDISENHTVGSETRQRQARYLIEQYSQSKYKNRPIILCGDFNAHIRTDYTSTQLTVDGKRLRDSAYPLDFSVLSILMKDASSPFKNSESFHICKKEPSVTTVHDNRVDYILVTPQVTLCDCGINTHANWKQASDHKPVWIDIPVVIEYSNLEIIDEDVQSKFSSSNQMKHVRYKNIECLLKCINTQSAAINEVLASKLYQLAGIKVPNLTLVVDPVQSHWFVLSELVEDYVDALMLDMQQQYDKRDELIKSYTEEHQEDLHAGYLTDVWLSNWDVAGTRYSAHDNKPLFANIGVSNNEIIRIDVGGSLLYRAQGSLKDTTEFGDIPIEDFHDENLSTQPSILYRNLGKTGNFETCVGLHKLLNIQHEQVKQTIDLYKDVLNRDLFERLSNVLVKRLDWCRKNFKRDVM